MWIILKMHIYHSNNNVFTVSNVLSLCQISGWETAHGI